MNEVVRRLVSKAMEKVAGSGVGIDAAGRLCFPDGLDPARIHRFIELVTAQRFAHPKAALEALFERVGVPAKAIVAIDTVLSEEGALIWSAVGRNPVKLTGALSSVHEIPLHFRTFLIEGLGFANETDATLEEAVVSTRLGAAESIGCEPTWEAILAEPEKVGELARRWREALAEAPPE